MKKKSSEMPAPNRLSFQKKSGYSRAKKYARALYDHLRPRPKLLADRIVILTKPSTLSVAQLVAVALKLRGFQVEILQHFRSTHENRRRLHIVLGPQGFGRLPPLRIAYQFEQSVALQFFSAGDVLYLKNALAIIDYSPLNLEQLYPRMGIRENLYCLPPCANPYLLAVKAADHPTVEKSHDLFFAGAMNARREKIIHYLSQFFSIRVANGLYGDDLWAAMEGARASLNVHFYEDAQHEVVRVQESISRGIPVISECSKDDALFTYPEGWVHFVDDLQSTEGVAAVTDWLKRHHAVSDALPLLERAFEDFLEKLNVIVSDVLTRLA